MMVCVLSVDYLCVLGGYLGNWVFYCGIWKGWVDGMKMGME